MSVQLLHREEIDEYGNHRNDKRQRGIPAQFYETRNGMPFRPYVYRGTGESMSDDEAEYWLCVMGGRAA